MDTREKLKLFQDLKDKYLPAPKDDIDTLLVKKDMFDINPNTNFDLLYKSIISSHEDVLKNFYNYNQTLTFSQRQIILNELNNTKAGYLIGESIGLSKESFFQKYFMALNDLKNAYEDSNNITMENFKKIEKSFKTIYYVDNKPIKIPLIYGTTELKYSGLINSLYQNLFFYKKEKDEGSNKTDNEIGNIQDIPKNKDSKENENKSSGNYPEVIIKHKNNININDNIALNNNKNENTNLIKMDVENEEEEDDDEAKLLYFNDIIEFISDYLKIICDDEFLEFFNVKNKYNFDDTNNFIGKYILNPEIDSLYFHLLFFDLLITIYSLNGNSEYDKSMIDVFFEKKKKKFNKLKQLNKYCKFMINNKVITFEDIEEIKNDNYVIVDLKDKNNSIIFNPYDYIFKNINSSKIKNFQDIEKAFNNPKNFSLNKIFKNKILFNDKNIFEAFKENIKNMLTTKVINQLYNQFDNYKKYENPYIGEDKEKFIQQTFDIIFYIPIPFSNIAGFTYKQFGIIFLNSKENIKRNLNPNKYFLKKICNISFKKVVTIHEIIGHYCTTLVHGNDSKYDLITPDNTLIDYGPKEEYEYNYSLLDGGERGESILFGNKIQNIFIKGALYILENKNFDNNLDVFRNNFVVKNNSKNLTEENFNVKVESNKNKIISLMKDGIKDIDNLIEIKKSNYNFSFRKFSSEESDDDDDDEQIFEDGVLYWNRMTHKDITYKK